MLISFESLRNFQRSERNEKGLSKLPSEFYPQCSESIKEMEKQAKDTSTLLELEGMKKTLEDILEMRERKILLMALHSARSSSSPTNLLPEEKDFFEKLLNNIIELRAGLLKDIFEGKLKAPKKPEPKPEPPPPQRIITEKPQPKSEPPEPKPTTEESKVEPKEVIQDPVKKPEVKEDSSKKTVGTTLPISNGRMSVEFLKELPSFMGTDSKAYGPVKKGDVLDLPQDVAEFLIEKKAAKRA